jgi:hypothetical protein
MSYKTKDRFTGNLFSEIFPYGGKLNQENRWMKLSSLVPWELLEEIYRKYFSHLGRPGKDSRLVNGLLIAKHLKNYSDEEVVEEFLENPYLQYFCGYDQFVVGKEIHSTTLCKMRRRVGEEYFGKFENEIIEVLKTKKLIKMGQQQVDGTVFPVNITYPTDIGLLEKSRRWVVDKIKHLRAVGNIKEKIRMYSRKAKQVYLSFSKKRQRTLAEVQRVKKQLIQYLRRNLKQLKDLLERGGEGVREIKDGLQKKLGVIEEIYQQQWTMLKEKTHQIANRIVSIHRSHIRPIVRGKNGPKEVEFGPKCILSYVNGYAFLDEFGYDAYYEGDKLKNSLELHEKRFGEKPKEVITDRIFGTRDNRELLKELGIEGAFIPLGRRPKISESKLKQIKKRQKRRGRMEGIIGYGKVKFGLERIKYANERIWIMLGLTAMNLKTAASRI